MKNTAQNTKRKIDSLAGSEARNKNVFENAINNQSWKSSGEFYHTQHRRAEKTWIGGRERERWNICFCHQHHLGCSYFPTQLHENRFLSRINLFFCYIGGDARGEGKTNFREAFSSEIFMKTRYFANDPRINIWPLQISDDRMATDKGQQASQLSERILLIAAEIVAVR